MGERNNELPYLSKSLFIRGLQCHKSLYLDRYHPELRDEIPRERQAVFESGHEVGKLARDLFPGGVEIPYEGLSPREQVAMTAAQIEKGIETIYEAAFSYKDVFMKGDILHRVASGWELYEVKQSTAISEVYENDVALQYYVLKGAGLSVPKACLVHINNQYVRHGDIEVEKLFVVEDLTDRVKEKKAFVVEEIARMREMLKGSLPAIDIGAWCDDPYECDFKGHCWQHIPENSVFDLAGSRSKCFALYRQGILYLKDVPLGELSNSQRVQLEAFLEKKELANVDGLKEFLDTLWYPLYFLDFETVATPVPLFDGTRPYQQIPYQYSLHYLEREGGELGHHEFIAERNVDPREELARRLVEEIPDNACVLAYNASFEAGILADLAAWLPQYKAKIETILGNIRDLAIPFRRKDVYHWMMRGSYSQKAVLPTLAPDLSYEGMEVANGGMAMQAYFRMCETEHPFELASLRKALLEYCKLDTLGMVRILDKLQSLPK